MKGKPYYPRPTSLTTIAGDNWSTKWAIHRYSNGPESVITHFRSVLGMDRPYASIRYQGPWFSLQVHDRSIGLLNQIVLLTRVCRDEPRLAPAPKPAPAPEHVPRHHTHLRAVAPPALDYFYRLTLDLSISELAEIKAFVIKSWWTPLCESSSGDIRKELDIDTGVPDARTQKYAKIVGALVSYLLSYSTVSMPIVCDRSRFACASSRRKKSELNTPASLLPSRPSSRRTGPASRSESHRLSSSSSGVRSPSIRG
jgi:hypothetical protein